MTQTNLFTRQKQTQRQKTRSWSPKGRDELGVWESHIHTVAAAAKSLGRVRLCATPETAAHQASLSLGFSRQEHWSGLPFPSPMHESEK